MIPIEQGFYIMKSRRPYKKYDIFTKYDRTKYNYLLSFGDKRYEQFRDSTPEHLYRSQDHRDPTRQASFFARHGRTTNKGSANYWSGKYLWS